MKHKVIILGAGYEKTCSFGKGASNGPKKVIECFNEQVESYDRFSKSNLLNFLEIRSKQIENIKDLDPKEMIEAVKNEYEKNKEFTILIGGEHTVSLGPLIAISKKFKSNDITIVQIDAHLDLRDTDEDFNPIPFGKYHHSTVMRRAHELGFNLVPIGIRLYSESELDYAKKNNIKIFEWNRITPKIHEIISSILTKKVYLTIDVDGIDPCHMPGTGTPVQGGLEWYYTIELIQEIFKNKEVIGADITEVAPQENNSLTEFGAAQLCHIIIANKFK